MTIMCSRGKTVVNVAEAKARFAELVRRAGAGEEIVIARDHRPVARLTAVAGAAPRRPGSARGRVTLAHDFGEPLADFDEYRR
jgi:prevent-host-death family protein